MFRELRATAPQTYYTFRASNGTADVLYVLLKSLTALGLQALFFEARKIEASHQRARRQAPPSKQKSQNHRRRATPVTRHTLPAHDVRQKKNGFLEVNFYEQKKC